MEYIDIKGAREHNLKAIDIKIPKTFFSCSNGILLNDRNLQINNDDKALYFSFLYNFEVSSAIALLSPK